MKRYEGMFIIKPDMNKEQLEATVKFIEDTITKNGGKVERCQQWAKRRLAYGIKRYLEGEYYICEFETEPKGISAINAAYRLNDSILRILITVKG